MLATWLIDHLMCGIYVGLPKGQFSYVITLDQLSRSLDNDNDNVYSAHIVVYI